MNRSEHIGTQQSLRVNADFDERVIINTQIDAQASYLRNSVGTAHTPFTRDGCTILISLRQFQDGDSEPV
jgi:hypothetical protein